MSRLALVSFRTVFGPPASRFNTQLQSTRLVKAEIMSPYCGILINTSFGNITVLFARPLGTGEFKGSREGGA